VHEVLGSEWAIHNETSQRSIPLHCGIAGSMMKGVAHPGVTQTIGPGAYYPDRCAILAYIVFAQPARQVPGERVILPPSML
jgi:hypothetical protein